MTPREAGIQAFYADEGTSNTLQGLNAAFDAYEAAVGVTQGADLQGAVQIAVNACCDVTKLGRFSQSVDPVRWVSQLQAHLEAALKAKEA